MNTNELANLAKIYIEEIYDEAYPLLKEKEDYIVSELNKEIDKFNKTIETGIKEFDKLVSGLARKVEFMKQKTKFMKNSHMLQKDLDKR